MENNLIMYELNQLKESHMFRYNDLIQTLYVINDNEEWIGQLELLEADSDFEFTSSYIIQSFKQAVNRVQEPVYFPLNKRKMWLYSVPIKTKNTVEGYLVSIHKQPDLNRLLQFLLMIAETLSTKLQTYRSVAADFLASDYQQNLCEHFSEGYITIDREGTVMYLNQAGSKILGLQVEHIVGNKLRDFGEFSTGLLETLKTGTGWSDREVFVNLKKGRLHLVDTVIPLFNEYDDKPIGILVIFKEIKSMRKMVNDMVGSKATFHFDHIIYKSAEMDRLIEMSKMAAKNDSNILIEGESGTGKELLVQSIHNHSSRKNGPFIAIDCSSIPRELIESELFGYVDGAFTGARKGGRMGKFELANGGTVFLDEIGEMPLEMQARLLRVLQNRTVVRVGGHEQIPINIRVISATNRDLEEEVKNKNFRLDLYFRLNVIHLSVPSLRERNRDIPLLIQKFIEKAASREMKAVPKISSEAIRILEQYSWPGNVRELENIMERAVVLSEGVIGTEHLPKRMFNTSHLLEKQNMPTNETKEVSNDIKEDSIEKQSLKNIENQAIIAAVRDCNGNISRAAKKLGISRTTLYSRLKKANIDFKPDLRFVQNEK